MIDDIIGEEILLFFMPANDDDHVNDLWEDMDRLNQLYEQLHWHHEDVLEFSIEGNRIVIYNKTLEGL